MADRTRTRSKNANQRPGVVDLPAPRRSSAQVAEDHAAHLAVLQEAVANREALNNKILELEQITRQAEVDSMGPSVPPSRRAPAPTSVKKASLPAKNGKGRTVKTRASKENQKETNLPVLPDDAVNSVSMMIYI